MTLPEPQSCCKFYIDLPLSHLHMMKVGEGPPLIMVPATISEIDDWQSLAQFMGQWFTVYFFELPGHGTSTPFHDEFSSLQVAELVEQLADHLGCERFNLMGFSFGGILAMRAFCRLSERIDRLILIAPCLGTHALPFSSQRRELLLKVNRFLGNAFIQKCFCGLIHHPASLPRVVKILQIIGRLEETIPLQNKLSRVRPTTVAVLHAQINEILTTEFIKNLPKYKTPCYFAMSIYDPLLRFDATIATMQAHFDNLSILKLTYPFHQPPRPFTFQELNRDFRHTVATFMGKSA